MVTPTSLVSLSGLLIFVLPFFTEPVGQLQDFRFQQQLCQRCVDRLKVCRSARRLCNNEKVNAFPHCPPFRPVSLPKPPLDSVPHSRLFSDFPTDGKGNPSTFAFSPTNIKGHQRVLVSLPFPQASLNVFLSAQSFGFRKTIGTLWTGREGRDQTVSRHRPFNLRRLMTLRPAFVDIRAKKP